MNRIAVKRLSLVLVFTILLLISGSVNFANEHQIKVFFDGTRLETGEAEPFIENGRTLVPFRAIFEAFGAEVGWDGSTKTVTGITDECELRLTVDKADAMVNGIGMKLDIPAKIKNNRTYVPLRFVAQSMGAEVEWVDSTKTINIFSPYNSNIRLAKGLGKVRFADLELGKRILTLNDDYIISLSEFDRSSKLKTDKIADTDEFKKYFSEQVMVFTDDEKNMISRIIEEIRPLFAQYNMNFPEEVIFIKTTGKEEANAAYTRSNSIILPVAMLNKGENYIREIVIHEFFHVFSRYNSEKREKLYGVIGFKKGPYFEYPPDMADLRISNPDAVANRYYIEIEHGKRTVKAVPVLYASEKFNTSKSTNFFDYLTMKLAVVEISNGRCVPVYGDGKPLFIDAGEAFYEKVGRNSSYIIQPEELLADNFVMMIDNKAVPSPFVIDGMIKVLKE